MECYLSQCNIPIEIYDYDANAPDDLFESFKLRWNGIPQAEKKNETGIRTRKQIETIDNAVNSDSVRSLITLIEYKGIGYEKGSDPKAIGHNTVKFIQNHIDKINRNNRDSYNDYVHCIWYCVTESRFEDSEKIVL
jgi:hypothetical protein